MGCMSGTKKNEANEDDHNAVANFLTEGGNLDNLWTQFDSNGDGHIDAEEFNNLVYVSLKYFCKERNPDLPPPTQEAMKPFIQKLVDKLHPIVDKDQNMQISKDEFSSYGTYLTTEFR